MTKNVKKTAATEQQPLWLLIATQKAQEIQEKHAALILAKEEKDKREEEQQRQKQLGEFTMALREILGEDAASQLLGGAIEWATDLEIPSGGHTLCYQFPGQKSGELTEDRKSRPIIKIWRLKLKRDLPDELVQYNNSWKTMHSDDIETADELALALAQFDERIAGLYARKADNDRRQAEYEAEEKARAEGFKNEMPQPPDAARPILSWAEQNLVDDIELLATTIRNGAPRSERQQAMFGLLQFVEWVTGNTEGF